MSPGGPVRVDRAERFPRVSGDEPRAKSAADAYKQFSPRERG